MEGKYGHVISAVQGRPWALLPEKLDVIVEVLQQRAAGIAFTPEEIQARIGSAAPQQRSRGRNGAIAVLPLYGVIAQRMNMIMQASGGTSTQMFSAAFKEAVEDDTVKAIVIDIDSPGGEVFGLQELASEMTAAKGKKPVVAVVNSLAASGAYWIGSQADEFVVTPGGLVGSIGVYMVHVDYSQQNEMVGVKPTYISAGKFKTEGNPDEPLPEGAQEHIQAMVDEYYEAFVRDVARGRGVAVEMVKSGYGEGRVLTAAAAVKAGLVDRVQTLEQVLARLGATGGREVRAPQAPPPPAGEEPEAEIHSEQEQPDRARIERALELARK